MDKHKQDAPQHASGEGVRAQKSGPVRLDALEAAPRSIAALSGTKRVVANAGANGAASWKRSKAGTSGDDAQAFEAERKQQP